MGSNRDSQLCFKMASADVERIERVAEVQGLHRTEWCRMTLVRESRRAEAELAEEMARTGPAWPPREG